MLLPLFTLMESLTVAYYRLLRRWW